MLSHGSRTSVQDVPLAVPMPLKHPRRHNEDSAAQVDANFVICENEKLSEIQVTGEEYFFGHDQYLEMYDLAKKGINELILKQKAVLD